ncbi:hypothetical protein GW17_00035209 [Ensete ventricosum]|uniref:Uncharacterized protein n=1 Tax=Ensete ventricosum TaxID=4639 RepID=A0A426XUY2_ENSVE|nr:hypothetical protein B296_00003015 [Ensete ventricosum]RWW01737.1 hypothetical protein GW17_00035209 [Ensete ventricosum]
MCTCKRGARSIFFPFLLLPSSSSRLLLVFSFPIAPSLAPGQFRSSPSAASFTVDGPPRELRRFFLQVIWERIRQEIWRMGARVSRRGTVARPWRNNGSNLFDDHSWRSGEVHQERHFKV